MIFFIEFYLFEVYPHSNIICQFLRKERLQRSKSRLQCVPLHCTAVHDWYQRAANNCIFVFRFICIFCVYLFWICFVCLYLCQSKAVICGCACKYLKNVIFYLFLLCLIYFIFLSKSRLLSVSRDWYLCANNHFRYVAQRSFTTWCKKGTTETMPYKLLDRTWFLLEHNSALPISAISNLFDWIAWMAANFGKL